MQEKLQNNIWSSGDESRKNCNTIEERDNFQLDPRLREGEISWRERCLVSDLQAFPSTSLNKKKPVEPDFQ
ncbi:unnamed protein product [Pleuronectes platessa]|uniref:Uncharacterized protein n=1 Tax=Pleuronectes platessa TaxID=8262 RepID=A0A9N7ZCJ7_PLEPL|nr:unnamed protein product [Pleuronectes platessa]